MNVEGIATTDNLMDRAQEFLDKGDMVRALKYVDRVLDIDAQNERARNMQRLLEGDSAQVTIIQSPNRPERRLDDIVISEDGYQAIVASLRAGKKILAIKMVRNATNWDLKRSKEYTEDVLMPLLGIAPQCVTVNANSSIACTDCVSSGKSKTITLLLCVFFGFFGAHCFYTGKVGKGILYLFTVGIFCIGWIWDIVQILRGKYTDSNGLPIIN